MALTLPNAANVPYTLTFVNMNATGTSLKAILFDAGSGTVVSSANVTGGLNSVSFNAPYSNLVFEIYESGIPVGTSIVELDDVNLTIPANSATQYFTGEVLSANDYYAFGATMPGRSFTSSSYRYGFNGKELDPEGMGGGGSTYDYGFRIYNPNLGRFLSVDPLTESYPWYTPYQFAGNKPIEAVDLDGLEEYFVIERVGSGKYTSERTYIKTGKDAGKGTYQFKDATDGPTVGEIHLLTSEMKADLEYINKIDKTGWKKQTIFRGTALKPTNAKEIEQNKQKTSTDRKAADRIKDNPLDQSDTDTPTETPKETPLKKTATEIHDDAICEICVNGTDDDHCGKSLKAIGNILIKNPNSKVVIQLGGRGDTEDTWGSEYGTIDETVLKHTMEYFNKISKYIVDHSGGHVTKDRIILDLGKPSGTKAKISIIK